MVCFEVKLPDDAIAQGRRINKRQQETSMTFQESIRICFTKYVDFNGRASRPEYWWFILFIIIAGFVTAMISPALNQLFAFATFLPSITAATRRLHDTNRSGWWQLIAFVPVLGWIVLIVFLAQESKFQIEY